MHMGAYNVMRIDLYSDLQRQKAVTAYLKSEQLLPFDFARQYWSKSLIA